MGVDLCLSSWFLHAKGSEIRYEVTTILFSYDSFVEESRVVR
ncbi:MAG: hypothetical protein [Olavius algarvensis Gamma 1 endosymbiont]|nr:MAG: hypothetical protein [Olavius algarvensis Gamma 1 endosymbiont]